MFQNFKKCNFAKHRVAVGIKFLYDFVQTKDAFSKSLSLLITLLRKLPLAVTYLLSCCSNNSNWLLPWSIVSHGLYTKNIKSCMYEMESWNVKFFAVKSFLTRK